MTPPHNLREELAFTCPLCRRVSHNPTDVHYQYCGACHQFFPDVGARLALIEEMLLTLLEKVQHLSTTLVHTEHYGLGRGGMAQLPGTDVP